MKKIGNVFLILSLLLFSSFTKAQVSMAIEVDRDRVTPGETITLSVIVSSSDDLKGAEPRLPDFGGFILRNVWSHSSSSSRMAIINGKSQFSTVKQNIFNYLLEGQKIGSYVIGPFQVSVDGKVFNSETIRLTVEQGGGSGSSGSGQAPPRGRPQVHPFDEEDGMDPFSGQDDVFEQLLKQREKLLQQFNQQFGGQGRGGGSGGGQPPFGGMPSSPQSRQMDVNTKEAFFIYAEIDKNEVYVGEQVTVSWYVYTRGQMETLDRLKFPTLRGFWKEIIEEVPALRFEDEIVNGVPYKRALLASHALFPIKAGNAVVDEFKVRSKVRLLENYGLGQAYTYTKSSKAMTIKVKPLPDEGKPSDFSGAVGDFSVRSYVENPQVQLNQPFSLKIRFEGEGNAKLIDLPSLNLPSELEVYDTKTDSKFFKNGTSYKEFDVVVLPRQKGTLTIPKMNFSFFNSKTGKYHVVNSEALEIFVGDAVPGASAAITAKDGKDSAKASAVVRVATPVLDLSQIQLYGSFQQRFYIYISVLGLILLIFALQSYFFFFAEAKSLTLSEQVAPKIKKVEDLMNSKKIREASAEMVNVFNFIFSKISRSDEQNLEFKQMLENTPAQLRKEYETEILSHFSEFEMFAFAPESMMSELLKSPDSEKKLAQKVKNSQTLLQNVVKSYDRLSED